MSCDDWLALADAYERRDADDLDEFEPNCPSVQCPAAPECGCVGTRPFGSFDTRDARD